MEPLSKKDIELMLQQKGATLQAMIAVIETNIKACKLPYKIEDGKLIEVGDSTEAWLSRFITVDKTMLAMKDDVRKLAVAEEDRDQLFCVLITGESGTGKEWIARALHGARAGEFVPINCAGLPSELVESELFGHVIGAFTGANRNKDGLMKAANRGTLFLDEIGELPLAAQGKLLRAIQSKRIRKVGGNEDESISCRIVCATHRNLEEMVKVNQFRTDLLARITTFELDITPLSKRVCDVWPIIESLNGGKEFLAAIEARGRFPSKFPYNVRTLQQWVKRYKVLGKLP